MSRWDTYRKLSRADRRMLLNMSLLLPIIAAAVRCFGFQSVFSVIGRLVGSPASASTDQKEIITQVRKNTRYMKLRGWFHGNCLSRSLMMWLLLRRRGIGCGLVFGSRFKDGEFQAHAWVEHETRPLNANRRVRQRYVVFEHNFFPDGALHTLTN